MSSITVLACTSMSFLLAEISGILKFVSKFMFFELEFWTRDSSARYIWTAVSLVTFIFQLNENRSCLFPKWNILHTGLVVPLVFFLMCSGLNKHANISILSLLIRHWNFSCFYHITSFLKLFTVYPSVKKKIEIFQKYYQYWIMFLCLPCSSLITDTCMCHVHGFIAGCSRIFLLCIVKSANVDLS